MERALPAPIRPAGSRTQHSMATLDVDLERLESEFAQRAEHASDRPAPRSASPEPRALSLQPGLPSIQPVSGDFDDLPPVLGLLSAEEDDDALPAVFGVRAEDLESHREATAPHPPARFPPPMKNAAPDRTQPVSREAMREPMREPTPAPPEPADATLVALHDASLPASPPLPTGLVADEQLPDLGDLEIGAMFEPEEVEPEPEGDDPHRSA